jgi:hypothetical protein
MVLGMSLDCNGDGIVEVVDTNCATLESWTYQGGFLRER